MFQKYEYILKIRESYVETIAYKRIFLIKLKMVELLEIKNDYLFRKQ